MEGVAPAAWRREAERLACAVAGVASVRLTGLADSATVATRAAAESLEAISIDFPLGATEPIPGQAARVDTMASRLRALAARAAEGDVALQVDIVGSADSVGTEQTNAELRLARAARIRRALIARGIGPDQLAVSSDTSAIGRELRQVRLRIRLSPRYLSLSLSS